MAQPMAQHRAARGQRCGEDAVCASHAAPLRGGIRKHEQSRDRAWSLAEPGLGDRLDGLADLLVELPDRRLNGHELRLDLDDEGDSSGRPPGEDVDRAALAERGVRDLDLDPPAETKKEADDDAGDAGMAGVEKPIEVAPAPGDRWRPARVESPEQPPHRGAGQVRSMATLDQGYGLLRQACPLAEFSLRQAQPVPKGPTDPVPHGVIHGSHDRERHVSATYLPKRSARKGSIGQGVAPSMTRSARISPISGANLKPWPEQADENATPGAAG